MKSVFAKIFMVVGCMSLAMVALADSISELPVKTIGGVRYHTYTVARYETVYSLCRRFGITRMELEKYNPSVVDGLKAGQELRFPANTSVVDNTQASRQETRPVVDNASAEAVKPVRKDDDVTVDVAPAELTQSVPTVVDYAVTQYQVQPKESAYGISRKFEMTLDEFYRLNPTTRDSGVKAGEFVIVKSRADIAVADDNSLSKDSAISGKYVVERGDTFSSLSRRFGISVAEIQAANPKVVMLKAGETIVIPDCSDDIVEKVAEKPEVFVAESNELDVPAPVLPSFHAKKSDEIVIALVLPFILSQEDKEKPAQLFAEYYKGFMLAVDSMRACGKPIKILAYDTEGTMQGVNKVMAEPLLATAQVIIGPDDEAQLAALAEYARDNGISVLNIFAARDNSYQTMDNVMNSIIPHTTMYAKAIRYFMAEFPSLEPVILWRKDGMSDKSEFIDNFKTELDAAGRKYTMIEFEQSLSEEHLAGLSSNGNYAFIPMSSKLSELKAVLPQLTMFAANSTGKTLLWGYPEWLSFRGDVTNGMHKLNTYIFSRFYNTGKGDPFVRNVETAFNKWYGGEMINVIPSQGLYGFDTAMYLLRALRVNGGDFNLYTPAYDGVQNCFNFVREDNAAGWVNTEMFIINYGSDGSVRKYPL